jgi:hypothetical protein
MRLDELFDLPAERTESTDHAYAALGRAITVATRFEAHSRALAYLLGIRLADQPLDEQTMLDIYSAIWQKKLAHHLNSLVTGLKLGDDVDQTLQSARKARNYLAHEYALGLPGSLRQDDDVPRMIHTLRSHVDSLAKGDLLVSLLSQQLTNEELPPPQFASSWPATVAQWVCDI